VPKLLAETARRVDGIVAATQASGRVPSLVAGVVRQGSVVHVAGAGEVPRPDPDMQYRIGSITKTMTAVLLLALRDEGRLGLDDPVRRHLTGAAIGEVTVRQLLAHVSGVRREPDGPWWERAPGMDLDAVIAALGSEPVGEAGDRYHYSNLGYGVLGTLAERITGQPWTHLLSKRLLEPLGLDRTTYHATAPFARGYVVHPWHGTLREEPRHDAGAMAPAGQLWSTVHDLAAWAAFLADPAPNVLRPETLTQMCLPVAIADPDAWTGGYGLGLRLWRRAERIYVGHTGSMPGYLAVLVVHRPSGTGVVAFANAYALVGSTIADFGLDLLDAVLDGEPSSVAPWRPGAAPPPAVEQFTGRWWWMAGEYEVTWDAGARELVMTACGAPQPVPWRFVQTGPDRWRCRTGTNRGETMTVRRGRSGAVIELEIATARFSRDPWAAR
jgi:CubicO group peptidase (beta-lactamase class C family)